MKKKAGFFGEIRYRIYLFNQFMRKVPILGIPWRIVSIWTDKEAFYDLAHQYGHEVSETIDDAAYLIRKKARDRRNKNKK